MYLENYIIISYIYIINRYFISSVRFTDFVHIETDYYDKKSIITSIYLLSN